MPAIKKIARHNAGFSLIEIVIGIVVLSVSLAVISTLFAPATRQSGELVQQIKAAELAQSIMNEVMGRAFDDNSDMVGGEIRCGENATTCTPAEDLGSEALESRATYDDVDDYDGTNLLGNQILTSLGVTVGDKEYLNYRVVIDVCYDGNYDGNCNTAAGAIEGAKKISIIVTTPLGEPITFTSYKANF